MKKNRILQVVIYFFPAFIDLLVGSFFFITTVRMAESGASAVAVGLLLTVWGGVYMITTPFVGRMVTPGNCVAMMICSLIGMALCAASFIVFSQQSVLYIIMAAFGFSVAFFFTPFMIFMKAFESGTGRTLVSSSAMYTFAWSLGLGAGPFIAGWLWKAGWTYACAIDIVLALVTAAGLLIIKNQATEKTPDKIESPQEPPNIYRGMPDLIWIAWIGSGFFFLALSGVRAVFPSGARLLHISQEHQGNALALICLAQAVTAFLLRNGRTWVYRPLPVAGFGVVGLAGLILFGTARDWPVFYIAAFCTGIGAGAAYIYIVFHAIVHPSRAGRYAGLNESIVGLSGLIGPFVGGLIGDHAGLSAPYFVFRGIDFSRTFASGSCSFSPSSQLRYLEQKCANQIKQDFSTFSALVVCFV